MRALKKLLTYEGLVEYLRKKGYKELREGEFVVGSYEGESEIELLVVRKGDNYKKSLNDLKKEIKESASIVEGERKEYGILFVDNRIIFLRRIMKSLTSFKVDPLEKSLDKITPAFEKKFKKFLQDVADHERWELLFDRTDIIEEFYKLYLKARENLLNNIEGITDDKTKEEFADNLMMQLLVIWYLQEKGFLDNNPRYLIDKFKTYKSLGFKNYYEFLTSLFEVMKREPNNDIYYVDGKFGRIVVTGPAPFLTDYEDLDALLGDIKIPDDVFYIENATEKLTKQEPKNLSPEDVPLLNLFESRDWTRGNIDESVLGAIFEKLMTAEERKEKGAYYTPDKITEYISESALYPYLIDKINKEFKFKIKYKTLREFFENERDVEKYKYLYEVLQDLKILDPACGSGHFLEKVINALVKVYDDLRKKAEKLGFDKNTFSILVADEKGNIHRESLLSISDEEEFKLKVKFHIIISKNIYGVDIQRSAINIARARMFLTLAEHFDAKKGIFVRFPNVHFNLRSGNSLIGFIDFSGFEKAIAKEKQATLMDFLRKAVNKKKESKPRKPLHLRITQELEDYLKKMDERLGLNTLELLREIKRIYEQPASVEGIKKTLEFKSKLMRIMLVSLNLKFAREIQAILRDVTDAFNNVLNEEFLKYLKDKGVSLSPKDLEWIGYFHWILEFPEVFLRDNPGFDIVLGNPPYVRQERINHIVKGIDYKEILSKLYDPFDNTFDFSMFFILRSIELLRSGGYHSFIITNKWLRAKYGKEMRKFLKENVTIRKVIDFTGIRVFVGATVDTMIYVVKKEKPDESNRIFYNNPKNLENIEDGGYYVRQSSLEGNVWNFVNERTLEIKEWIEKVGMPLKELDIDIYRGIITGFNNAFIINDETRRKIIEEDPKSAELIKPLLRGRDIGRYYAQWDRKWIIVIPAGFTRKLIGRNVPLGEAERIFKNKYPSIYFHFEQFKNAEVGKGKGLVNRDDQGDYWWELRPCDYYQEFEKEIIIYPDISSRLSFFYGKNVFLNNTCYFMRTQDKVFMKYLLVILNSTPINFYYKIISSQLGKEGVRCFTVYIKNIPIYPSHSQNYQTVLITKHLAEYLLFLNATKERREKLKGIINFFDHQIAGSLVYELYFKEKFSEDSVYPEPQEYLSQAVSKHLKPINYDRWAELYWKKQIGGELTKEEEEELERLEKENLGIIKEVYESLKNSPEVQEWIDKIRSHEWIKVIEESG